LATALIGYRARPVDLLGPSSVGEWMPVAQMKQSVSVAAAEALEELGSSSHSPHLEPKLSSYVVPAQVGNRTFRGAVAS
jgi:hypothetical protein